MGNIPLRLECKSVNEQKGKVAAWVPLSKAWSGPVGQLSVSRVKLWKTSCERGGESFPRAEDGSQARTDGSALPRLAPSLLPEGERQAGRETGREGDAVLGWTAQPSDLCERKWSHDAVCDPPPASLSFPTNQREENMSLLFWFISVQGCQQTKVTWPQASRLLGLWFWWSVILPACSVYLSLLLHRPVPSSNPCNVMQGYSKTGALCCRLINMFIICWLFLDEATNHFKYKVWKIKPKRVRLMDLPMSSSVWPAAPKKTKFNKNKKRYEKIRKGGQSEHEAEIRHSDWRNQ